MSPSTKPVSPALPEAPRTRHGEIESRTTARGEASPARATVVTPAELGQPRGFNHGWLAPANARLLFVAGQTAADVDGRVAVVGLVAQFEAALAKALAVVAAAGGHPEHIVRMTVYVTDMDAYLQSRKALGEMWRRLMGRHYPAMALVGVTRLVDAEALVEVEVTAAVPMTTEEMRR